MDLIYIYGQNPYTPEEKPTEGTISGTAEQCMQNLKPFVEGAGSGLE
jgi:enamine deaminase RidA (YjgF/YER057c/UK114 family)